jgi:hypothetical protein
MTTFRKFVFDTELEDGHQEVAILLWQTCTEQWWFTDPEVSVDGKLSFSFWAAGRDQWFCHLRAIRLATDCVYAAGGHEADVPIPAFTKKEPHTNRGYLVTM